MTKLCKHLSSDTYSPWDLLPAPVPKDCDYPEGFFYHNVAKHLIKDTVRIMNNGLHIDLSRVEELEKELIVILDEVNNKLANNQYIQEFQAIRYKTMVDKYVADRKTKLSTPDKYIKPFKHSDMTHRSYFMNEFSKEYAITQPSDLLPTGVPKWTAATVNKFTSEYPALKKLVKGTLSPTNKFAKLAMKQLAKDKSDMYNQKYVDQISNPILELPPYNPASSQQKQSIFAYLGIESEAVSKDTGLPSWSRKQVERVNKLTTDPIVTELTQCFIDHSFAAIINNNFIAAFYNYTISDRLYGQYKLIGAKTGRYTSSNPNMLNMPSSASIFAKPVKKCFTARKGFLIATADYSALEDRVIANLSGDINKSSIFLNGLDGHCLNAYGYFKKEISQYMTITEDTTTDVLEFKRLVDEENQELNSIRSRSKAPTFKLAYGGFPDSTKGGVITQEIFDNYHNVLYPGITDYRENYVLKTVQENGYIHLGLGFNIYSDDPEGDIRTLNNSTCQFWSILTAITINKMHQLIDANNLQDDIIVTSTIYDSIYFEVREDAEVIHWLNQNLIPVMVKDFMLNQTVPNDADLEIGPSWAELHKINNNASLEDIQQIMESI